MTLLVLCAVRWYSNIPHSLIGAKDDIASAEIHLHPALNSAEHRVPCTGAGGVSMGP